MAGTRLYTQLAFVIGVLLLVPLALFTLRSPPRSRLPPASRRLQLQHQLLEDPTNSNIKPRIALHVYFVGNELLRQANEVNESLLDEAIGEGRRKIKIVIDKERWIDDVGMKEPIGEQVQRMIKEQSHVDSSMEYRLLIFPMNHDHAKLQPTAQWDPRERCGWLTIDPSITTPSSLASSISHLAMELYTSIWTPPTTNQLILPPLQRDLRLTLLSEDPAAYHCTWDASRLMTRLAPGLAQLAPLAYLPPQSQLVSYGQLLPPPSVAGEISLFPPSSLHHYHPPNNNATQVINRSALAGILAHMEEKVLPSWAASSSSSSTSQQAIRPLHMIFYCPASPNGLVFVEDEVDNGRKRKLSSPATSSMIDIQGFGGIAVLNVTALLPTSTPPSSSAHHHHHHHQAKEVVLPPSTYPQMTARIHILLRRWLGLRPSPPSLPANRNQKRENGNGRLVLQSRELDQLIAQAMQARIQEAFWRLETLQKLVEERRPQMPLPLRVARAYEKALECLEQVREALLTTMQGGEEGQGQGQGRIDKNLEEEGDLPDYVYALSLVNQALSHVLTAQGDHALMPSPYFPLEHYAAVFLPLVLPLVIPLLLGLKNEWRRYQEKLAAKQGEGERGNS